MNIGIIGYSGNPNSSPIVDIKDKVYKLGKLIAERGWIVVNGGRDGIMEIVSKGAKEHGGKVIGILPFGENANEYVDIPIKTEFGYAMRSFLIIENSDVCVSIGGEIGTAIEILLAYAKRKPLIFFEGTGGWTDRFKKVLIDGKYLDSRRMVEIKSAKTPEEIVELIENYRRTGVW